MLLLHISDIHFRSPDCLTPDMDPERPFRTRLVQDAHALVQRLGPVDAMLVGGDIAFKGDPDEYDTAFGWIKELAAETRCALERVFIVPGNHDVDRAVTGTDVVQQVQHAIADAEQAIRERTLRSIFNDAGRSKALLSAQSAYNDFAKRFNCQFYAPDRLSWKQDIEMGDDATLRIFGLTSTLLSGKDGLDDQPRALYLSPLQTVLDPVENVLNLVMCHHPPDWLMDGDDANDDICARARLQFYGHKHRQRIEQEQRYVRFSAGAVNPDRREHGWNPGYNLIELSLVGDWDDRRLLVRSHLRQWQTNPDLFRAMQTESHADYFEASLPFPRRRRSVEATIALPVSDGLVTAAREIEDSEAAMGDETTRNLVFRFWNLSVSQRRAVALQLNLLDEGEMSLPEPERYGRALRRAGERGQLTQLADEVSRREL